MNAGPMTASQRAKAGSSGRRARVAANRYQST